MRLNWGLIVAIQQQRAIAVRLVKPLAEERMRLLAKIVLEIIRPSLAEKEPFDVVPLSAQLYEDVVRAIPPFYEQTSNAPALKL